MPATHLPPVNEIIENCIGCRWTLPILHHVRDGVLRPGALERAVAGITTKVMNERLARLVRYGLLERTSYPEVPPRVEYRLTPFGARFLAVLDQIEQLRREYGGG